MGIEDSNYVKCIVMGLITTKLLKAFLRISLHINLYGVENYPCFKDASQPRPLTPFALMSPFYGALPPHH